MSARRTERPARSRRALRGRGPAAAAAAAVLASVAFVAGVGAQPPAPELRFIPEHFVERHRSQVPPPGAAMECDAARMSAEVPPFEHRHPAGENRTRSTLNGDDDTAHYARGNTLVCHVFVDHNGGEWDGSEEWDAAMKAQFAIDYFTAQAPEAANVHFDNGLTDAYYAYNCDLTYALPESTMTWFDTEVALFAIGFRDVDTDGTIVDDASISLQSVHGGFDNVLMVFQPADQPGRAFADYNFARTVLFTSSWSGEEASVWAHEWGHLFGACDEYEEDGGCNIPMDCGPCQSEYLNQVVNNTNCELESCNASPEECLMNENTFSNICGPTLKHWAWDDSDDDGLLDPVKRRVAGSVFEWLYQIPNGGRAVSSDNTSWVTHQTTQSWGVTGIRGPAGGDHNLYLFGDNNLEHNYASSTRTSGVDFIVADYNHTNLGNEHYLVTEPGPAIGDYILQYESGTAMLPPDGAWRTGTWTAQDVVRVWDVPLFGGETVQFTVEVTSGALDLKVALFDSEGIAGWNNRSGALLVADGAGVGGTESFQFTAPASDVYGLVFWTDSAWFGTFRIQVGPTPVLAAEELVYGSTATLALYDHTIVDPEWAVVGTRPTPGTDVTLRVTDQLTDLLQETSSTEPNVELVAMRNQVRVDVQARVSIVSGAGAHETNFETGDEVIHGIFADVWPTALVAKAWDIPMLGGQEYFIRSYAGSMDTGLYLFGGSGDPFRDPTEAGAVSNSNPAGGGEWLSYLAPFDHSVGLVQIDNVGSEPAGYQIWAGPRVELEEDIEQTWPDVVVWGITDVDPGYWGAVAVRGGHGAPTNLSVYSDHAYTVTNLLASSQNVTGVNYIVADFNHAAAGSLFTRMWHSGVFSMDMERETGPEKLVEIPGVQSSWTYPWDAGDVVKVYDLFLTADRGVPRDVPVEVADLSGTMNLGLALFDSQGAVYYADRSQAAVQSDSQGIGGTESVVFTVPRDDWYGLVVTNPAATSGSFEIRAGEGAVSAPVTEPVRELALAAAPSPFRDATSLRLSLPRAERVDLTVHDVTGRAVRKLDAGMLPAGRHVVAWDGRDGAGRPVAAGVYFVRMSAGGESRTARVVAAR